MKITDTNVELTHDELCLAKKAIMTSQAIPAFYFESWMRKKYGSLVESVSNPDFFKAIELIKTNKYSIKD